MAVSVPFVGSAQQGCGGGSCSLSMSTCNSEGRQSELPHPPERYEFETNIAGDVPRILGKRGSGQPCGVPKKTTHPGTPCPAVAFP